MIILDNKLVQYLRSHKVGVLSVRAGAERVHGAVMHFSFDEPVQRFYFSTDSGSRKMEALKAKDVVPASLVVGLDEIEWVTLQMTGRVAVVSEDTFAHVKEVHYAAIPSSRDFEGDPNTIFLSFSPTWARLTDFNVEPGSAHEVGSW